LRPADSRDVPLEGCVTIRRPVVAVVDDDESARESLPDLVRELGYAATAFASAQEFLAFDHFAETGCLLLDVAMPGMSGPELQQELTLRACKIPIIFITARTDKGLASQLLERGAVACLFKPFSERDLRVALAAALPEA
jgi:FixJ family two-component response regulator